MRRGAKTGIDPVYHSGVAADADLDAMANVGILLAIGVEIGRIGSTMSYGDRMAAQLETTKRVAREPGIAALSDSDIGNALAGLQP
jgi:hypothetical protein